MRDSDFHGMRGQEADAGSPDLTLVAGTYGQFEDFDRQLLFFVASWAPYGGPPAEEVLPRFGFPSAHLRQRVLEVADRYHKVRVGIQDQALMACALAWARRSAAVFQAQG